jgi:hypothetical protein
MDDEVWMYCSLALLLGQRVSWGLVDHQEDCKCYAARTYGNTFSPII